MCISIKNVSTDNSVLSLTRCILSTSLCCASHTGRRSQRDQYSRIKTAKWTEHKYGLQFLEWQLAQHTHNATVHLKVLLKKIFYVTCNFYCLFKNIGKLIFAKTEQTSEYTAEVKTKYTQTKQSTRLLGWCWICHGWSNRSHNWCLFW